MKIYSFDDLVGKTLIYNEKSAVAVCKLTSAKLIGSYQEFTLEITDALDCEKLGLSNGDDLDLGFETEYITYESEIVSASYYITWRLIFNEEIIAKTQKYIVLEGVPLGKYVRGLVNELLYAEIHPK